MGTHLLNRVCDGCGNAPGRGEFTDSYIAKFGGNPERKYWYCADCAVAAREAANSIRHDPDPLGDVIRTEGEVWLDRHGMFRREYKSIGDLLAHGDAEVGFESEDGTNIVDPWSDETYRFPVDPAAYYEFGGVHTGGGCMALERDGVLLTNLDGTAIPTKSAGGWMMGEYDDGDTVWLITVDRDGSVSCEWRSDEGSDADRADIEARNGPDAPTDILAALTDSLDEVARLRGEAAHLRDRLAIIESALRGAADDTKSVAAAFGRVAI